MTTAVQLSVSAAPPRLVPGQQFDTGDSDIISCVALEAIPFGAFVNIVAEDQCELPDTLGEANGRGGIAIIDYKKGSPRDGSADPTGYVAGDMVRVLKRGRVCVLSEEALAFGDTLFVRYATGTGTQKGAFRNDADTTTAGTPVGMALHKPGGINLAVVDVNLP